jgi:preprotein translocase subunit SecE
METLVIVSVWVIGISIFLWILLRGLYWVLTGR